MMITPRTLPSSAVNGEHDTSHCSVRPRRFTAVSVVSVDVVDSGPGVPPSQRARIFEAFVSQDAEGTGLGLPIARELAVALGGGIELGSSAAPGGRFRLVLPVSPAA